MVEERAEFNGEERKLPLDEPHESPIVNVNEFSHAEEEEEEEEEEEAGGTRRRRRTKEAAAREEYYQVLFA